MEVPKLSRNLKFCNRCDDLIVFIPTWIIPAFLQVSVFCCGYKEHQTTPQFPECAHRALGLPLIHALHCDLCPLELCQMGSDDGTGNQALYENIHECVTRGKSCKNNSWEILYSCTVCIKIYLWLCTAGNCNCCKYCKPVTDFYGGKSPELFEQGLQGLYPC